MPLRKSAATGVLFLRKIASALDETAAADVAMIGVCLTPWAPSPDIAPGLEPTKIASTSDFHTAQAFSTDPNCSTQSAPDASQASARVALSKLPETQPFAVEILLTFPP